MRSFWIAMIAVLAIFAFVGPTYAARQPDPSPTTYWQIRGCTHHHLERRARAEIRERTRSPLTLTRHRWHVVWHFAVCVKHRSSHLRLRRLVKREMSWRRAHYWDIRLAALPASWRAWAERTAWCESKRGTDPRTNLNGFRGIFQWVLTTWYAAGGTGDPAVAGYAHEAVIAIGLAMREGTGHWPRCG